MSLLQENANQVPMGPSSEQIIEKWKKFSGIYVQFDSTPQTFYYTLANMLKLNEAKNVL